MSLPTHIFDELDDNLFDFEVNDDNSIRDNELDLSDEAERDDNNDDDNDVKNNYELSDSESSLLPLLPLPAPAHPSTLERNNSLERIRITMFSLARSTCLGLQNAPQLRSPAFGVHSSERDHAARTHNTEIDLGHRFSRQPRMD
jgi:hypothetical protein